MKVKKVEYEKDYKLKLWFSDGKIKVVDLAEELKRPKGVFIPLKDLGYFKQVSLDDDEISICWPNGADFCPDFLYQMGKNVLSSVRKISKRPHAPKSRRKPRTKARV
jgi:hypothetical protein